MTDEKSTLLVREPYAGKPPVRFDEREVETEHGMRILRHVRGNPDTEYAEAYPTAPPLDSTRQALGIMGIAGDQMANPVPNTI
jgi:hypothetical protein